MANREERDLDDRYEAENDPSPVSADVVDDSYTRETRNVLRASDQMPVITDEEEYEDPVQPPYSDSNEGLGMLSCSFFFFFFFPFLCLVVFCFAIICITILIILVIITYK